LKKQSLLTKDMPTVAGILLFSEEPQGLIPKHCGIKVYRYATQETEGFRDVLTFVPITVEGCLYEQIKKAVSVTISETEKIPHLGAGGLEKIKYPHETLHEIITNAVIHRDYSLADDIHVRIFDNRIEVQSPGRLPAHVTPKNILDQRFARNGAIVRLLNKFPDPPNRDVGEGLNTAFERMHQLGLKEP
jgi:ATP-dependent DNA helicase RecG